MVDGGIQFVKKAGWFVVALAVLALVLSMVWTTFTAWGDYLGRPFGYVSVTGVVVSVNSSESSVAYLDARGQPKETAGPRVRKVKARGGTRPLVGDQVDLYIPEYGGAATSGEVLLAARLDLAKVALCIAVFAGVAALWALFGPRHAASAPPQGSRAEDEAQRQLSLQRSIDQEIAERVAEHKRRGERP